MTEINAKATQSLIVVANYIYNIGVSHIEFFKNMSRSWARYLHNSLQHEKNDKRKRMNDNKIDELIRPVQKFTKLLIKLWIIDRTLWSLFSYLSFLKYVKLFPEMIPSFKNTRGHVRYPSINTQSGLYFNFSLRALSPNT